MPQTYAVDTNVVIYYCSSEPMTVAAVEPLLLAHMVVVPSIVVTELWSGKKTKPGEFENIEEFLATTLFMPLDIPIAKLAGTLRHDHKLSIGDSIVAATALAADATLLTRNVRDFKKVSGLKIQAI